MPFIPIGGGGAGGGGGGGPAELDVKQLTHTTGVLSGSSSEGDQTEDFTFDLDSSTGSVMVVGVAVRRASGTGSSPQASLLGYLDSGRSGDYIPFAGGPFSGISLPEDNSWWSGPAANLSGTPVAFPLLIPPGTTTLYMRAKCNKFGSTPDDDASFDIQVDYIELGISYPV